MPTPSNQAIELVDPFSAMAALRTTMNRLFEDSVLGLARFDPVARTFALDIQETDSEYIIDAALPGVKPEDTEITASDDTLTIRVKRSHSHRTSAGSDEDQPTGDLRGTNGTQKEAGERTPAVYVRRERYIGEMTRSVTLPTPITPDKVAAQYEHGVLTIRAPKVARVAPKRIPVQINSTAKPVAASEPNPATPVHQTV